MIQTAPLPNPPCLRRGGSKGSRLPPLLQGLFGHKKKAAQCAAFSMLRLPCLTARRALRATRQRFAVLGLGHQVLLADLEDADGQPRAGDEDRGDGADTEAPN